MSSLLLWALALLGLQLLLGGGGVAGRLEHLATWAGFALTLAAYPAGIAAARHVFEPFSARRALRFAAASVALGIGMLVLVNWVAPDGTLLELRERAQVALARADASTAPDDPATWEAANHWGWLFLVRLGTPFLAVTLSWIGLLVGYWSARTPVVPLRRLQQWIIGLCLVVTTYFAGENTYELVLLRAAGPVFFLAWLRLLAPAVLLCGLSWTTLVELWLSKTTAHA